MTPAERQRRVDLILAFQKILWDRATGAQKALKQLGDPPGRWSGFDDDADARRDREYADARARQQEILDSTDREWRDVANVFGRNDVDLALSQLHQRIGNLPYVD